MPFDLSVLIVHYYAEVLLPKLLGSMTAFLKEWPAFLVGKLFYGTAAVRL